MAKHQRQLEVPIAVSNRHVHLSKEHVERLFGRNYQLNKWKDLSQPGQFASKETVTLIGPKGKIEKVRVLGPARGDTQVEISLFDGFTLGVTPPIRDSGDIDGTPSIIIQGPRGQLKVEQGLICAARHIHMNPEDAAHFNVTNGERVQVKVLGQRGVTFDHVLIRVSPRYKLEMHIDLDEANAAQIKSGQLGVLLKG
ncbi:phosphate propanoyltransferase [Neobacillus sp. D3-1R]|uniref:phosphate propanoyltransferase n=1 Tax=Neobacillus sp. D3-1R TaxID=3445778 RepID=UPI003FA0E70D